MVQLGPGNKIVSDWPAVDSAAFSLAVALSADFSLWAVGAEVGPIVFSPTTRRRQCNTLVDQMEHELN